MTDRCFINSGYGLLDLTRLAAIELAVWDAEHHPVLDTDGPELTTDARSRHLLSAIQSCPRSVHDVSLSRGTGRYQHSRSNMVYEAALAISYAATHPEHAVLVTFPLGYRVERSLFDLLGGEPPTTSGVHRPAEDASTHLCAYRTLGELHALVREWLSGRPHHQTERRVLAFRDALTADVCHLPVKHRQHPRFQRNADERQVIYNGVPP